MFKEGILDKTLRNIKKLIPKSLFDFLAPFYHAGLAWIGAFLYGFPSRSMKIIGVTGTKGKSTTVFLISKILEGSLQDSQNKPVGVAAIGSLGFKIKDREWPNNLKMTMPGRFKIQKFLAQARKAGCRYVALEVTSEGIKQKRHLGISFDCAVFTNLHKEHLESHGSFENYLKAKQELFKKTKNIHILNGDDPYLNFFSGFDAKHKMFYGINTGDIRAEDIKIEEGRTSFEVYGTQFNLNFGGKFNIYNCLSALSVGAMYKVDLPTAKPIIEKITNIKGRMEYLQKLPFSVVVDYAHTPDSLEAVYKTLKDGNVSRQVQGAQHTKNLICVLGAAGGGRDKWKRPEFGKIAAKYCDEIILTNEDPYDENPNSILNEIESGFSQISNSGSKIIKYEKILDRKEAIKKALTKAKEGDIVIITGKGSEISMALAGGKKIPWSDQEIIRDLLK
ncbi:MAG: hypothetical protein COV30_01610 [Candidatus Yanofskybacteria bacterium CG10_big_fil_rev_8_21_14_0_10_37_15]|uniref:UDP-N-acetylmuramyl-tripeptide synthetase n=1 Tax=Candidatus Yanofskybacteria bacterium CG10_big_fil_rev_8_21_14_0_10_37_15 TaxID=1975097 RepID=A0A2H0R5R5_9BACT|nr:MAG: hypothetical protein COV30_01610 [Candidatus Yanofskybacteria bacterium CG10_big_fil_rev_8_21_14_0_10_37_15]